MEDSKVSSVGFIYDKCPVCEKIGKSLACCKCTKNNNRGFLVLQEGKINSNKKQLASLMYLSRNLEIKLKRFHNLINEISEYKLKATSLIGHFSKASSLKSDICHYQTSINQLKQVAKNQQLELQKRQKTLHKLNILSTQTQKRVSHTINKKRRLEEYIESYQESIKKYKFNRSKVKKALLQQKIEHVALLRQFIFPITDVTETGGYSSPDAQFETEASGDIGKILQEEIDEARRLSFVNGRWVDQQIGSDDAFQISVAVSAASAPSDGNYSSYVEWLEENHSFFASDTPLSSATLTRSAEPSLHQPLQKSVLRISAALGHAAQMMLVTRKILFVHLPHRINYRAFCNPSIPPEVFINAVKLLNCNILSLCLQQGVDGSTLHPLHTLRNLQILSDKLINDGETEELFVPDMDVLESMKQTLVLGDLSDDESDDDPDVSDWRLAIESDWQPLEPSDFKSTESTVVSPYISTNTQSSILSPTSGLVSSAVSWAKGWWNPSND